MTFTLTAKQLEAQTLARSRARFILFRGGSRSGKSFANCYFVLNRALVTPRSRHGVFRLTAVDVRRTLFDLTFKDMMNVVYPGLWDELKRTGKINESEMTIELPNGALILFAGLDDSTRQERILGDEYSTIFVNEVSQFRDFDIIQKLITRLSLELPMESGKPLTPKLFLDCNPPKSRKHWTYRAFKQGVQPISGEPHPRAHEWAEIHMNPEDNAENIASTYLDDLQNLSVHDRKRFLEGEWGLDTENAMFLEQWWSGERRLKRVDKDDWQRFKRIVVSVDPAGSSKLGSDETGIIVVGQDDTNDCFVLEDCSGRYQPHEWGGRAIKAYWDWNATEIIVEADYGGEMVKNTITAIDKAVNVVPIKTKGKRKDVRAGPVATQYEQGHVWHCGSFEKLEGQLEEFKIDWNRNRDGSPDRLDALVWAITVLIVNETPGRGGSQGRVTGLWG
ncbi:phage terminase large subunit [Sphingomonas sp. AR_OL41]|uniref:phage terminase large subunit n=1 Tax=Sphingomonas sp. AR_OL41 TaxID=3042729 RepID=UPI002480BC23|nr:phage terminase large subunit [Sphingomonas sp. AR_OL41]MDH7971049.1 phage terminase large subunit [Sphingomonas sp. AR_OL41]